MMFLRFEVVRFCQKDGQLIKVSGVLQRGLYFMLHFGPEKLLWKERCSHWMKLNIHDESLYDEMM